MTTRYGKPVLVTGGCGFIGCNIADRLAARGDDVTVFDNLARSGVRENAQWLKSRHGDRINIVVADIRDPIPVIDAVRDAGAVIHLAAQVAVTDSHITEGHARALGALDPTAQVQLLGAVVSRACRVTAIALTSEPSPPGRMIRA